MEIGVIFPQTEIGPDVGAMRAYGQCADELGYHHVLTFDHVVGADPAVHQGWKGPYDIQTHFHEPFVLFGFLAWITSLYCSAPDRAETVSERVVGSVDTGTPLSRQPWRRTCHAHHLNCWRWPWIRRASSSQG